MVTKKRQAELDAQTELTRRFTICPGSGETVGITPKPKHLLYRAQCPRCAYENTFKQRVSYTTVVPHHFPKEAKNAMKKITAATINAELRKRGIAERLVQGRGYVYFIEGNAAGWRSSSIPVCYVSHLVEDTLEATVESVLRERELLRKGA